MQHASPLRYPGGKASLSDLLEEIIDLNGLRGCTYFEPYAGGAGAALTLLARNVVSRVSINDADKRIYSFWHSAINESQQFVDRIFSVPVTISEWKKQREICVNHQRHRRFDVGFAAFFLNRCNRSGVIDGAGPIGGMKQKGRWRLDARFNRGPLAERILQLAKSKDRIKVSDSDAVDFLKHSLPRGQRRKDSFVYLDPPYVDKAKRLYLNSFQNQDHARVANYVKRQKTLFWIMSYDDSPLIRELYRTEQLASLPIRYSLQEKRSADELVIAPSSVRLPKRINLKDDLCA